MALSIEQIAQVSYDAGFRDEALVTAIAVARGESGWDPNATGDVSLADDKWGPSLGLFQVRSLHAETGTGSSRYMQRLHDPAFNARAAFEISSEGRNFGPWSVYKDNKHLPFMGEARQVVTSLEASGTFEAGTIDIPGTSSPFADPSGLSPADAQLRTFLEAALAQRGDEYVFGALAKAEDPDPDQFDCSELVQWAAAQAGVEIPTASYLQFLDLKGQGATVSVQQALATPGALVFRFPSEPQPGQARQGGSHVGISLGNGQIMEARSSSTGVNVFDADDIEWTHGGVIPEFADATGMAAPSTEPLEFAQDSDADGVLDEYEIFIGTDPFSADTDRDGYLDLEELLIHDTDPLDYASNVMVSATGQVPQYVPLLTNAGMETGSSLIDDILSQPRPTFIPARSPTNPTPAPAPAPPPEPAPGPLDGADDTTPDNDDAGDVDPGTGDEVLDPRALDLYDDPWMDIDADTRAHLESAGFDESRWTEFTASYASTEDQVLTDWFTANETDLVNDSVGELTEDLIDFWDS